MKIALISTCTNRKRFSPETRLCAGGLPKGNLDSVLSCWKMRLSAKTQRYPADQVYCGRGFSEILDIAEKQQLEMWIISSGLGLISKEMQIPSYNLTIVPNHRDSIQDRISSEGKFSEKEWWLKLNKTLHGTPFPTRELIKKKQDTFFVISVSQSYLKLISEDLCGLSYCELERVRLLGFRDRCLIPERLREFWMPYDERFDGPDSPNPGTRADFPQRVAKHFVYNLRKINNHSPQEHSLLVETCLASMRSPTPFKRTPMTDDGIKEIIANRWSDAKGSGTRMLRILRDDENVACEQARFASLFREVKSRMS